MTEPAAFAATYADWKLIKTRKCVQIVFEVPLEAANEAYAALGGMPNAATEAWFGIARLVTTGKEVTETASSPSTLPSQPASDDPPGRVSYTWHAVTSCRMGIFQLFLNTRITHPLPPIMDEDGATIALCYLCGVKALSDLKVGTPAGDKFEELYSDFLTWTTASKYVEVEETGEHE